MGKIFSKKTVALVIVAMLLIFGIALIPRGEVTASALEVERTEQKITLNAGQGTFDGASSETVVSLQDGVLPLLPVPVREGWEFVGWFDAEVEENFWGDEAWENPEKEDYLTLKATYESYKNVLYQWEVIPVAELSNDSDRGWKELTFRWICITKGNEVRWGDTTSATALYALYKPEIYTVYWHFNGWLNTYDESDTATNTPHRTMPQHGGYFVDYELDQFPSLQWENHAFLGWYLDPACTMEYTFQQVGAYKINETPVEGDLHLYAKWEATKAFDGEILVKKPLSLIEPKAGETFTINCSYSLGASKVAPVVTGWESSDPEAVTLVSGDASSAVFAIGDTNLFSSGNRQVFIYVTVEGVRYTAADITVGHSWGNIVRETMPTCTQTGQTVYKCKFCDETKTVTHAANGHRYVQEEHLATCTEDAYIETHCIVCGLEDIKVLAHTALGHSWNVSTAANCFGTTVTTTCERCALSESSFDETAKVHNWAPQYTIDRAATCAHEGEKSVHCLDCDAKCNVTAIPVDSEAHAWSAWSDQSGFKSRSCELCGKSEAESVPLVPAQPKPEPKPEPTPEPQPEPEPEPEPDEELKEEIGEANGERLLGTPNIAPSAETVNDGENGQAWLWIVVVASAVVVLGGIGAIVLVKRRQRKMK